MGTGAYTLITALNVNGINASTERHRLAEWIQKQDPCICCQETHLRLKVRGRKKIFHANGNHNKSGVVMLRQNRF